MTRPIDAFRRDGYCSSEHFGALDSDIRALEVKIELARDWQKAAEEAITRAEKAEARIAEQTQEMEAAQTGWGRAANDLKSETLRANRAETRAEKVEADFVLVQDSDREIIERLKARVDELERFIGDATALHHARIAELKAQAHIYVVSDTGLLNQWGWKEDAISIDTETSSALFSSSKHREIYLHLQREAGGRVSGGSTAQPSSGDVTRPAAAKPPASKPTARCPVCPRECPHDWTHACTCGARHIEVCTCEADRRGPDCPVHPGNLGAKP